MLNSRDSKAFKDGFQTMVALTGVSGTLTPAKAPENAFATQAALKIANRDDTEIVNAYGIGTKIFTMVAEGLPLMPEKFDVFSIAGQDSLTLDEVWPIRLNNEVIGYKCIVRGK